jgi:hypothetical protein
VEQVVSAASSGTIHVVEGDCLILFILSLGNTASSLFRPRRNIHKVFDGVFLLVGARIRWGTNYSPIRDE